MFAKQFYSYLGTIKSILRTIMCWIENILKSGLICAHILMLSILQLLMMFYVFVSQFVYFLTLPYDRVRMLKEKTIL